MLLPDEIWDEYRWEAFLREHDRQLDRFMNDLYEFMRLQPPPSKRNRSAYHVWKDSLRSFLRAKGWKHLGFMSLDSEGDYADSSDTGLPLPGNELSDEDADVAEDVQVPPVYRSAILLGSEVLEWANSLPGDIKDSSLVQFCSSIMEIASNLARGHDMGYEQEMIGGNIAFVKRALNAANTALGVLYEMKTSPYMGPRTYTKLYEQTYEVRNDLALYVLDLRERFELGID